jgi:hypothetical protein
MGNSSFSNVTEPVDDQNGSAASAGRYDDSSSGRAATSNRMNPADMGGSGANASGGQLTDLIGQLSALVRKLGDAVGGAAQQSGQAGKPTATDAAQGSDGSGSATAGNAAQAAADPSGQSPRTASGGAPRPTEDSAGAGSGSGSAGARTAMLRPEDQQPGSGWTGAGKTGPDSGPVSAMLDGLGDQIGGGHTRGGDQLSEAPDEGLGGGSRLASLDDRSGSGLSPAPTIRQSVTPALGDDPDGSGSGGLWGPALAALTGGSSSGGAGGSGGPGGSGGGADPRGSARVAAQRTSGEADLSDGGATAGHAAQMDWRNAAHGDSGGSDSGDPSGDGDSDPAQPSVRSALSRPGNVDSAQAPDRSGSAGLTDDGGLAVPTSDGQRLTITPTTSDPNATLQPDPGNSRYLIQARNASAPSSYDFQLGLPQGSSARANRDGGVDVVDAGGQVTRTIAAPWARDANGRDLPTSFTVHGNTLTQHIAFDENTAFPVIADPAAAKGKSGGGSSGGKSGGKSGGGKSGGKSGGGKSGGSSSGSGGSGSHGRSAGSAAHSGSGGTESSSGSGAGSAGSGHGRSASSAARSGSGGSPAAAGSSGGHSAAAAARSGTGGSPSAPSGGAHGVSAANPARSGSGAPAGPSGTDPAGPSGTDPAGTSAHPTGNAQGGSTTADTAASSSGKLTGGRVAPTPGEDNQPGQPGAGQPGTPANPAQDDDLSGTAVGGLHHTDPTPTAPAATGPTPPGHARPAGQPGQSAVPGLGGFPASPGRAHPGPTDPAAPGTTAPQTGRVANPADPKDQEGGLGNGLNNLGKALGGESAPSGPGPKSWLDRPIGPDHPQPEPDSPIGRAIYSGVYHGSDGPTTPRQLATEIYSIFGGAAFERAAGTLFGHGATRAEPAISAKPGVAEHPQVPPAATGPPGRVIPRDTRPGTAPSGAAPTTGAGRGPAGRPAATGARPTGPAGTRPGERTTRGGDDGTPQAARVGGGNQPLKGAGAAGGESVPGIGGRAPRAEGEGEGAGGGRDEGAGAPPGRTDSRADIPGMATSGGAGRAPAGPDARAGAPELGSGRPGAGGSIPSEQGSPARPGTAVPSTSEPRSAAGTARLPRDIAVNPTAPRPLDTTGRSIGRASHNRALQADIDALPRGAEDIRVNQQQVNALGQRVGINRPDLQYTLNGQRHYVEYEGPDNPRGAAHEARIKANDPGAEFELRFVR